MPDTENVIQLSRLFGVSCDYLLRDEVDEQGVALPAQDVPQPAAPGETHLTEQGWVHNAFALSLGVCTLGLTAAFMFYRFNGHTLRPLAIGFMIQVLGVVMFELSTPRMGSGRSAARLNFYAIACWLMLPCPMIVFVGALLEFFRWSGTPLRALTYYFAAYLLLGAAVTAVLSLLRRQTVKK